MIKHTARVWHKQWCDFKSLF